MYITRHIVNDKPDKWYLLTYQNTVLIHSNMIYAFYSLTFLKHVFANLLQYSNTIDRQPFLWVFFFFFFYPNSTPSPFPVCTGCTLWFCPFSIWFLHYVICMELSSTQFPHQLMGQFTRSNPVLWVICYL